MVRLIFSRISLIGSVVALGLSGGQAIACGQSGACSGGESYEVQQDQSAYIQLLVPEDADVFFDGYETQQRGLIRDFVSPQLEPGYSYSYTLEVHVVIDGREQRLTRQVIVRAGEAVKVDFFQDIGNEQQQQQQQTT